MIPGGSQLSALADLLTCGGGARARPGAASRPTPIGSQPYAWPPAVGEFNSSGLQYSANGCQRLGVARKSTRLDLGDGVAINANLFRQFLHGPIQ